MKTRKRKAKNSPSPAQLRARAKFVKMVRARAKARKKANPGRRSGKPLRVVKRSNPGLSTSLKGILKEYVKDGTSWTKVQSLLIREGLSDKQIRAAEEFYAQEAARIPRRPTQVDYQAPVRRASAPRSNIDLIVEGLIKTDPGIRTGALVSLAEARKTLKREFSTKQAFDKAVLAAATQGRIVLHRHVFPGSLSQKERDEMVTDGERYYIGAAFREANPRRRNKTIIKANRVKIMATNPRRRKNALPLPATSSTLRQSYDLASLRKQRDRLRANIQSYAQLVRKLTKDLRATKDPSRAADLRKRLTEIDRLESREVSQLDTVLRKLGYAGTIRKPKRNAESWRKVRVTRLRAKRGSGDRESERALARVQRIRKKRRKPETRERLLRLERAEPKRNPRVTAKSRATKKLFTGTKSKKTLSLLAPKGAPKSMAILGKLVNVKTRSATFTPPRKRGRNPEGEIYLAADDSGRLHIVGESLPVVPGPARDLGQIDELSYLAEKVHLGYDKPTEFFHELGEEGGRKPHLVTDSEGHLKISGGDYYIERDGIHD